MPYSEWRTTAEQARDRIADFGQCLLQVPSLSGQEEAAADLVAHEMRELGYDEVRRDEAGNILGRMAGGPGRSVMLHAHMDVVDSGKANDWDHPPFSGHLEDGWLWGRGASDDKGCIAAQVYAAGLLREMNLSPAGDLYVAAVVNEEDGGAGTRHLLTHFRPDLAIIGEPSGNTLRRGHRGRFEFIVSMHGRSAHASAPDRGRNPHYSMARFLLALRETPMFYEPVFGGTSVAPTLSYVDQTSSNVIPAQMTVHLDWRVAPGETFENAETKLQEILDRTLEPDVQATISLRSHTVRTYTGYEIGVQHDLGSYCMALDDPLVRAAHRSLEAAMGHTVEQDVWAFCTDGGFIYAAGIPCIGFGPGEETMAHVRNERIAVDQLVEAVAGYMGLGQNMGNAALFEG